MWLLKQMVSGDKKRFQRDGFDLDLTYITDNFIAMGFPAEGAEGLYRNSMADTERMLEHYHRGADGAQHYRVYNLCPTTERRYDHGAHFGGNVGHFPFPDHHAPPLQLLAELCADAHQWLAAHPDNVCAVHCKAGKGRTGCVICCHLLHAGLQPG